MKLSTSVKETRARFVAKFPVPSINSGEDQQVYEERCRRWSIMLAEQIAIEHPTQGYAVKRGDSGRPICKDCLAQFKDGKLLSWDMLNGASSGHPTMFDDPDALDLTGPPEGPQFFENRPQFFQPTNHLGSVVPPVKPPVDPPDSSDAETLLLFIANMLESFEKDARAEIKALGAANERQYLDIIAHFKAIPTIPPAPEYEGSLFGARFTLKPK